MYQCRMTPYEGSQPYIFISYAHKDSDEVLPILDTLSGLGFRVWYDDGIAPGSEWPEYIATHLAGSRIVLAFVSPDSIASANCRREVTFALAQNKPFIGIYLRDTVMSPGMEMQLSAQQCLMKHRMTEEAFYSRLCAVDDIVPCRVIPQVPANAPVIEEIPAPANNPLTYADMNAVNAMKQAVAEQKNAPAPVRPPVTPQPQEIPIPETVIPKPAKKRGPGKKLLIIPAAVLVIAIAVAAVVLSQRVTICGETHTTSDTYLYLSGQTITDADISAMNRLKDLCTIHLENCEISGNFDNLDVSSLTNFNAVNCDIYDVGFLGKAENLAYLTLENCGVDSGFPDLSAFTKLREVDLSDNPDFSDLSLLPLENLTALDVSGTAVSDFSAIAAMTNLTSLDISNTAIEEPTDTIMSLKLTELRMDNVPCQYCDCMEALTILETLSVCNCHNIELEDVLEKNAGTLKTVLMDGNDIWTETADALSACTGLETLSVNNSILCPDNVDYVSGMSGLKYFSAVDCNLSDVSALDSCTALEEVHLDNNYIKSFVLTALTNLTYLTLDNNRIQSWESDLSALPNNEYDALTLSDTPIDFFTFDLTKGGRTLVLDYADGLEDLTFLSNWTYVYIIDCPLDKQVALEDASGVETYFVDEAGAIAAESALASSTYGPATYADVVASR